MGRFDDVIDDVRGRDPERKLSTERLVLIPVREDHAAALYPQLADARLYPFIPDDPPASIDEVANRFRYWQARRSPDGDEAWLNWVAFRSETEEAVGLLQATVFADDSALIAYTMFTAYQRQGFAKEACLAVIDELRHGWGTSWIGALVDTRNTGSIRLLERLGFRRTETIRDADFFKGGTSDEFRYELDEAG